MRQKREYLPSEFVPDNKYRVKSLPDEITTYFDGVIEYLSSELYHSLSGKVDVDYNNAKDDILRNFINRNNLGWKISQSERTVVSIGHSFSKKRVFSDPSVPLVIKFNPSVALPKDGDHNKKITKPGQSGNISELVLWKNLVDEGYAELLPTIYDYADNGSWIVMKKVLPTSPPRKFDGDSAKMSEEELDTLTEKCEKIGLDPHTKRGNIGIETSPLDTIEKTGDQVQVTSYSLGERPVIVDGGSHTSI